MRCEQITQQPAGLRTCSSPHFHSAPPHHSTTYCVSPPADVTPRSTTTVWSPAICSTHAVCQRQCMETSLAVSIPQSALMLQSCCMTGVLTGQVACRLSGREVSKYPYLEEGVRLILTGSADRVAIFTPLAVSSLYFRAKRPISVVQTGCKYSSTLDTMVWEAVQT